MAIQVGLGITKDITVYNQTISLTFWCPTKINADSELFKLQLTMRGYPSKAYFLANGKRSFYEPATVVLSFSLTQQTWPFIQGQDPWPALWALIKSKTEIIDVDGNEINGGLDWSTSVDQTIS